MLVRIVGNGIVRDRGQLLRVESIRSEQHLVYTGEHQPRVPMVATERLFPGF